MKKHDLDWQEYGFICFDEWDAVEDIVDEDGNVIQEAGSRYAIRYDELSMFLWASL